MVHWSALFQHYHQFQICYGAGRQHWLSDWNVLFVTSTVQTSHGFWLERLEWKVSVIMQYCTVNLFFNYNQCLSRQWYCLWHCYIKWFYIINNGMFFFSLLITLVRLQDYFDIFKNIDIIDSFGKYIYLKNDEVVYQHIWFNDRWIKQYYLQCVTSRIPKQ